MSGLGLVDCVGYRVRLLCDDVSVFKSESGSTLLTLVNVRNDHFCAFVCKESRTFGANALSRPCNDGQLALEKTLRVVKVAGHLL